MSYNIRHGVGLDDSLDLSRIANIIRQQQADLCALQEIDQYCLRSDSIDQTQYLGDSTGMLGTFGKFMDYQGGAYGMATLSKWPLNSSIVLKLPDGKYEPRSSIVQELKLGKEQSFVFANVHFDWIEGEEGVANRMKQAKALISYINQLNTASIIVGDFNCTPDAPTINYFKQQGFVFVEKGKDNLSYQGENKNEIDHILFKNSDTIRFHIKSAKVLEAPIASDHRPVLAEIEVVF